MIHRYLVSEAEIQEGIVAVTHKAGGGQQQKDHRVGGLPDCIPPEESRVLLGQVAQDVPQGLAYREAGDGAEDQEEQVVLEGLAKIRACNGAFSSPFGAGIRSTIASSTSSTP